MNIRFLKPFCAAVVAAVLCLALPASAKDDYKIAWSIYVGWMPWGYAADVGIVDKWAEKYGLTIEVVQFNDYIESINQYTAGAFDGCTMTNMDALTIPAAGGVDSTVTALLLHRALGERLHCFFVDNGLLRRKETERVRTAFERGLGIRLRVIRAADRFLARLSGVSDPERKRKAIGEEFIRVFEEASRDIPDARFLAQGTLYPDVIESVSVRGPSSVIKSHHNVGGLPEKMNLGLVEPLRELFKDEVRVLGRGLGAPTELIDRHPFPGPGLAVRMLGPVGPEGLDVLREADAILEREIRAAGWYERVWQAFCVLLPLRTVGVMGDARTYERVVVIRAVESRDGMTADWVPLPFALLARISNRITGEVRGVNRVVLDITSKPPGTIEWE